MAEMKDRSIPFDLNAEAAVLSAMMKDPISVMKGIDEIKEHHFYNSRHRILFNSMVTLFNEQMEVDLVTLLNRLESSGQLEKAGGKEYIDQIDDIVMSGANFSYHCKILQEKYVLRELILTSNRIVEKCYEGDTSSEELLDFAEQSVFQLYDASIKRGFLKVSHFTTGVLKTIQDLATSKLGINGLGTGYHKLDGKLGGFRPGQLIILAARPSMGKSALALNIANYSAQIHNIKVGIFSMEMSAEEVLLRMISSASGVMLDKLIKGYGINHDVIRKVTETAEIIGSRDIFIDDTATNTPLELRAKTRRLKSELDGLGLIIIDYLQLLSTAKKNSENRQQEIADISRNLKILAKEMDVPVLALSQLNREVEKRGGVPRLSDLRESGAIEQDADVVMFIHKDEAPINDKDKDKGEDVFEIKEQEEVIDVYVTIAKNRHGPTGTVKLKFRPKITSFEDDEDSPPHKGNVSSFSKTVKGRRQRDKD